MSRWSARAIETEVRPCGARGAAKRRVAASRCAAEGAEQELQRRGSPTRAGVSARHLGAPELQLRRAWLEERARRVAHCERQEAEPGAAPDRRASVLCSARRVVFAAGVAAAQLSSVSAAWRDPQRVSASRAGTSTPLPKWWTRPAPTPAARTVWVGSAAGVVRVTRPNGGVQLRAGVTRRATRPKLPLQLTRSAHPQGRPLHRGRAQLNSAVRRRSPEPDSGSAGPGGASRRTLVRASVSFRSGGRPSPRPGRISRRRKVAPGKLTSNCIPECTAERASM